ncbi:thioredoxin-like protein [Obelidium mucronatum]|nr:thioredoxin-like protein [Obelidium mucronatum]
MSTASPIKVGDKVPAGLNFTTTTNPDEVGACAVPKVVKSEEILGSGKVLLVAVPGAFTPGCHLQHLPGYIKHADAFKAKGIDQIFFTSTNDVFVLDAWAKHSNAKNIQVLADGNGAWAAAIGLVQDLTAKNMGIRSKRYAILFENGIAKLVAEGDLTVSGAEVILARL